jgi:uncharacterized protein (TIGR02217 family)
MSQAVFPGMPGIKWGSVKSPMWSTKVVRSTSGREQRAAFYSSPLYKISLSYEVLRSGDLDELQTMVGFFNARKGAFENFLWQDPEDNAVTLQGFGIAVSGQTQYQLVRSFGGVAEPVLGPVLSGPGAVNVYVNGALRTLGTHYTLSAGGLVTFLQALNPGDALAWSGSFYYRVRFANDSVDFERFLHQLWALKKVELITVRDAA